MKTNCGKTTSLIHREVDDENKLISNIAAKKIKANMGGGGLEGGSNGTRSSWSHGEVYEEKSVVEVAKEAQVSTEI